MAATVAIAGVGLIGGSLGFALKKHSLADRVIGVSSPATLERALRLGAIDAGASLPEAVAEAEIVVLAQPISRILAMLGEGGFRAGQLVTDVGSTKARIVAAAAGVPEFLGGHPMAGKESRGVEGADPDLFRGRPWILTPAGGRLTAAGERWRAMLETMGARVSVLEPAEHDELVALSSHLPQLLSTALASALAETGAHRTAGPGLIDMTRLALSPFEIWSDILATNEVPVRAALDRVIGQLMTVREQLGQEPLRTEFERASAFARRLREQV